MAKDKFGGLHFTHVDDLARSARGHFEEQEMKRSIRILQVENIDGIKTTFTIKGIEVGPPNVPDELGQDGTQEKRIIGFHKVIDTIKQMDRLHFELNEHQTRILNATKGQRNPVFKGEQNQEAAKINNEINKSDKLIRMKYG